MKNYKQLKKDDFILRKFGNWFLSFDEKGRLMAANEWVWHQIILYTYEDGNYMSYPRWSCDFSESLPFSVTDYLWKESNLIKLGQLQAKIRGFIE